MDSRLPVAPRALLPGRMRHVLVALLFASGVCVGMLAVRLWWAHTGRFLYLFWNLLLAWIPLALALLVRRLGVRSTRPSWNSWGTSLLWLLFFPNSFYLITDLIHMNKFGTDGVLPWFDMMVTAAFGFGGVFLGCLSLYLMHLLVRERLGYRWGWSFAVAMLALGSFGIYLGRFLRLNSWDFVRPLHLVAKMGLLLDTWRHVGAFCATLFFFSLMAYWFVVAVARLHEGEV